ncbi:hypothetical protein CBFG_05379 [Clostridiales bacterium 1_7_47FAA]|nr:hypothetical protein CBFG_05379 [Clostridiales bacterium 1_7_47FAA]
MGSDKGRLPLNAGSHSLRDSNTPVDASPSSGSLPHPLGVSDCRIFMHGGNSLGKLGELA